MKEWNNPQLFSLSVENTFSNDKENGNDTPHYCHKGTGGQCNYQDGNHGNDLSDHTQSNNWHANHKGLKVNPHPGYDHCCCPTSIS